ncbi:anti-sigma factor [Paraburkholderia terrae]|uniref:anti-sigma factor n=1 Tax=Paraburkholderia terrae TaxID=311230 RepID=UPI00296A904A|nr:anti-sigma factor [Paraburkholderia terrae]MDW3656491.1 anti-sigma factor [Paraburkholderia terrae]
MNTPASSDENDLRCAEYVLGVLSTDERREIELALQQQPGMVGSLDRWQTRLMPLTEDLVEVIPPSHVWNRVQAQLGWDMVAHRAGLWNSLSFWRWTGLTSSVAACALAIVLTRTVTLHNVAAPAVGAQYLVASLERQGAGAGWTATVDAQHAQIVVVPPHDFTIAANQSTEMWVIPLGAKPISLGVIDTQRPTVVHVAQAQLQGFGPQTTLAVSLEPHGGSPTGQPTGPVLAAGHPEEI